MSNLIHIPISDSIENELKTYFTSLAKDVINTVKKQESYSLPYMDKKQACKYLGISFVTFQKLENMGLPIIKIENKQLISKETLDKFLSEHEF